MSMMNFSIFDDHWKLAYNESVLDTPMNDPEGPELDMWDTTNGNVTYMEWEEGCVDDIVMPGQQGKCFVMRYNTENVSSTYGNKHGIVRIEWEDGSIEESTWYGL